MDWVLTGIFGIVTMGMFLDAGALDLGEAELAAHLAAIQQNFAYLTTTLLLGALATALGAYFAARKANAVELKTGLWVAIVSAMFYLAVPGDELSDTFPVWAEILGWLLWLPSGVLGGYIAKQVPRAA